ncbi:MAG: serine/threonine-protein kinase [Proteobacteria bacterium]|nr:serine/threonine-protein kinase [Pseudomonadota bacterium]
MWLISYFSPIIRDMMNYKLIKRIALGGMAEIYLAIEKSNSKQPKIWCIKKILPEYSDEQDYVQMFEDEFNTLSMFCHENLITVKEIITIDDTISMVMEFIPSVDIRHIFQACENQKIKIPIPIVCYIISAIAKGLDYVHKITDKKGRVLKIIHRDISPQNILISFHGQVKIIDFGVADRKRKQNVTKSGVIKGKFSYMSPEQVTMKPIDHRTDLFALGIIFWEALAIQKLFQGANEMETIELVKKCEIRKNIQNLNQEVDDELAKIILKALSKNINERYHDCQEFATAIDQYLKKNYQQINPTEKLAKFVKTLLPEKHKKTKNLLNLAYEDHQKNQKREQPAPAKPRQALPKSRKFVKQFDSSAVPDDKRFNNAFIIPDSPIESAENIALKLGKSKPLAVRDDFDLNRSTTPRLTTSVKKIKSQKNNHGISPYAQEDMMKAYQKLGAEKKQQQTKTLLSVVAAVVVVVLVVGVLFYGTSQSSENSIGDLTVNTIPRHLKVSLNGKAIGKGHTASPLVVSADQILSSNNTMVFSREGFHPRTYEFSPDELGSNDQSITIALKRKQKMTSIVLHIHPQSVISSVKFNFENNLFSGRITRKIPVKVSHLLHNKSYQIHFQAKTKHFQCHVTTSREKNRILKYTVFIDKEVCQNVY